MWKLLVSVLLVCIHAQDWSPILSYVAEENINVSTMLQEARGSANAAANAILATLASSGDNINTRVVSPKPLASFGALNATSDGIATVYVDTNSFSRKYKEIQSAGPKGARVNLIYFDSAGVGYVSLRGTAVICAPDEAKREYWSGWDAFYPDGSSTAYYSLIRIEPDWMEFVSVARYNVQSNRSDWAPPSLSRVDGTWHIEIPAPVPPTPPSPPAKKWVCSVCAHVYDPEKDGNGVAFEDLPDTWKCPICGAPKSAYHNTLDAKGQSQWVHMHDDDDDQ